MSATVALTNSFGTGQEECQMTSLRSAARRWFMRAAIGVATVTAAALAVPSTAHAYSLQTAGTTCGGTGQPAVKFAKPTVKMVVHYGESQTALFGVLQLLDAVNEVNGQFNLMGGTAARVTSVQATSDPFTWDTPYKDTEPTIHVGFVTSMIIDGVNHVGAEKPMDVNGSTCTYNEAHIAFLDLNNQAWDFGEPATFWLNDGYDRDTTVCLPNGKCQNPSYFRPNYLHELLHGFGLQHSDTTFSFMDYGAYPWANRPDGQKVRPLPDDLRAMRYLYPDSSTRYDVALLNSWDDDSDLSGGSHPAATAKLLCAPSLGADFDSDPAHRYSPYSCGTGGPKSGSLTACAGDSLKTRFALVNYSTEEMDASVSLYFSVDTQFDRGTDIYSGETMDVTLVPGGFKLYSKPWKMPALTSGQKYYSILRVTAQKHVDSGSVPGQSLVADWIPLRGTMTGC